MVCNVREILLINVAGEDQPGITSAVSRVLDEHGADILDIGQSVIHDNLNLGLLVKIPDGQSRERVQKEILFSLHAMDMAVRFQPISEPSYDHWVAQQGKPRHIVTLLARRVSAHHIARVTAVTVAQGLNIDKITRLSGRVPLRADGRPVNACVEFSVRGGSGDQIGVHLNCFNAGGATQRVDGIQHAQLDLANIAVLDPVKAGQRFAVGA